MKLLCAWLAGVTLGLAAEGPNVLIIMADDCTYNDLPAYGGVNAKTPNLDRLAGEGLVFNHAYLAEAMCQPCRAELYTGLYPMRNGCAWNHSASRPDVTGMPQHLGKLGYRVGIAGKVHVKPAPAFPFVKIPGFDPNCVRNPTRPHEIGPLREFFSRKKPFCAVVALVEPHVPWVMGDASQYPPQQLQLPPNLADTPKTRDAYSRYLAEITYMDGQVGEILQALEASGKADHTLVLFTSEQGAQFPGCKWTNWNTGVHTALMARWPGRVPAGRRTDALVQYADVLPTLADLAGGDTKNYDGSSFKKVLLGESDTHREFVYAIHNNLPEGPAYPVRGISDGQYRYLLNLLPDEIYIEKHLMGRTTMQDLGEPYWNTWVWSAAESPESYALVKRYTRRPAVALYHTAGDPYELTNLAGRKEVREVEQRLRTELHRWMAAQKDPGAPQDTRKALQAARQGKHLYGVAP